MPSPSVYAIELPYLGAILLGKSPLDLASFQKPLRELYILNDRAKFDDRRRIIISDCDILIFESDAAVRNKHTFIYSNFESVVDIQILKLSLMVNHEEDQQNKRIKAAFLPIGCEDHECFRSLYSIIHKSQCNLLRISTLYYPTLLLFVIRKPGSGNLSSLLDCHVFTVYRESTAFDLCNMIRKLIIKRTMSPTLPRSAILIRTEDHKKEVGKEKHIKYLERNRPVSTMTYQQTSDQMITDRKHNHLISNVISNDVVRSTTGTVLNPLSSARLLINNVKHSSYDIAKVLAMNRDTHHMLSPLCSPSKQRHFVKASSLVNDESDEIVNDLLNIVVTEQVKGQIAINNQFSFDETLNSDVYNMNKKRYFYNKRCLINSTPTINNDISHQQKLNSVIDYYLVQPQIVPNRYGDIGNYVPKSLRKNYAMRSSDSNENIFFRSTNEQLLNGFIKLDFLTKKPNNGNHNSYNHHHSTTSLNQDSNIYSLVQQLRKNQTKSLMNIYQPNSNVSNRLLTTNTDSTEDDHRIPHIVKSLEEILNDIDMCSFASNSSSHQHPSKPNISFSSSKPKRVPSMIIVSSKSSVDYRQYLRNTDQAAYLYREKQMQ